MGRWNFLGTRSTVAGNTAVAEPSCWHDELAAAARANGAMPYAVEGFMEIFDAVRRGHAVMLRREQCEVAEGVTVFDEAQDAESGCELSERRSIEAVTVLRFDVATARFIVHDPVNSGGTLALTAKRLQRYVASGDRATGVALGR